MFSNSSSSGVWTPLVTCRLSAGGSVSASTFPLVRHAGDTAYVSASRPVLALPAEAAFSDGDSCPVQPSVSVLTTVPTIQAIEAVSLAAVSTRAGPVSTKRTQTVRQIVNCKYLKINK